MASTGSWKRLCICGWLLCNRHLVSALKIIPRSPSASQLHNVSHQLTPRATSLADASCPVEGYTTCGNGMADYFCCPIDTTCMILAERTTVLCCPKGSSCDILAPITCDVSLQDVVRNPTSPIHTTRLKQSLPQCGSSCCPFGYTCRADSVCFWDVDPEGPQTTSTSVSSTKTIATSAMPTLTQEATATTVETIPAASSTPSATLGHESPTPSAATSPSETETRGGIIAGTTIAAIASVAGLTCLVWFKRRSISESVVGPAEFLTRPWQQLREHNSEQDVSLPRYTSPPPAYAVKMKPPLTKQFTWKHYSPDSVGRDGSVSVPVELPATPVSFSQWLVREEGEATRPRSHYEPYRRP
ncbi:hypothetical protein CORC01_01973 [Colletotrichum orchidophilum]|uniref:GPI transamidase component PIG-S n=1 Tax=Colletotrichum orchidophilum TaxID=1209926 RepID=A0A1G4BN26_9PEZI|nr:uncharacterized protein CORC01_01973 [Colletotrichum orchidophilum]OHF02872.1 hypothetical protein CORC01_01973 [Colletotrichum orchidophilum]